MKDIMPNMIERYNKDKHQKEPIYSYLKGNIIHLDEDIKRFAHNKNELQVQRFRTLKEYCCQIQDKITYGKDLVEDDLEHIWSINSYNAAKRKEMLRLAVFTLVVVGVWILVTALFK